MHDIPSFLAKTQAVAVLDMVSWCVAMENRHTNKLGSSMDSMCSCQRDKLDCSAPRILSHAHTSMAGRRDSSKALNKKTRSSSATDSLPSETFRLCSAHLKIRDETPMACYTTNH